MCSRPVFGRVAAARDTDERQDGEVDGVTLGAFSAAAVIGGANFLAVKLTLDELDPLFGAASRFALGGLVFFAILALMRIPLPRGRALAGAAVYGALGFGAAYALMYVALVELSVGVASVLMATVPVFALVLAAVQRLEPITVRGLAGGVLAVAGIAVLSARSLGRRGTRCLRRLAAPSPAARGVGLTGSEDVGLVELLGEEARRAGSRRGRSPRPTRRRTR